MSRDLILQKAVGSIKYQNVGKLAPNWEGPHQVTATTGVRAYYLEDLEERPLPRPWNIYNLKKYYP